MQLFKRLGIRPAQRAQKPDAVQEEELLAQVTREPVGDELFYDATRHSGTDRAAVQSAAKLI
ncbi:hypothetical protein D3C80_2196720 [compost metagenome]